MEGIQGDQANRAVVTFVQIWHPVLDPHTFDDPTTAFESRQARHKAAEQHHLDRARPRSGTAQRVRLAERRADSLPASRGAAGAAASCACASGSSKRLSASSASMHRPLIAGVAAKVLA